MIRLRSLGGARKAAFEHTRHGAPGRNLRAAGSSDGPDEHLPAVWPAGGGLADRQRLVRPETQGDLGRCRGKTPVNGSGAERSYVSEARGGGVAHRPGTTAERRFDSGHGPRSRCRSGSEAPTAWPVLGPGGNDPEVGRGLPRLRGAGDGNYRLRERAAAIESLGVRTGVWRREAPDPRISPKVFEKAPGPAVALTSTGDIRSSRLPNAPTWEGLGC